MKRIIALFLTFLLCLSSFALADNTVDNLTLAVNDGSFCVFVGWNNYLYRSDSVSPLVEMPVRAVQYADLNRVIFSTVDEVNQQEFAQGASLLWALSLDEGDEDPTPREFAEIIGEAAVYIEADATIYYVNQEDNTVLQGYSPFQAAYMDVVDFHAAINAISASVNGLLVYTDSAVYLYNAAAASVTEVQNAPEYGSVTAYSAFETRLDGASNLSVCAKGQTEAVAVDTGVTAVTAAAGIIYYIRERDTAVELCSYNYSSNTIQTVYSFTETMLPEIVSDGSETIYMLGSGHAVYRYNVHSNTTDTFYQIQNVEAPVLYYAVPSLLIYEGNSVDNTQTFVTAVDTEAAEVTTEIPDVLGTPIPYAEAEPTAAPATAAPAPAVVAEQHADLTKGSRGDDVKALQEILKKQGYPVGSADGIYGSGTRKAVRYLQGDMGLSETGKVAYEWLQTLKSSNDLPTYEVYVELKKGDMGIRVTDLQTRLKALGWLSGKVDGDYGSSTYNAVKDFQKKEGLTADGVAGTHTLKALFSKNASKKPSSSSDSGSKKSGTNSDYIDDGYIVDMVRWMNEYNAGGASYGHKSAIKRLQTRLHQLGYLKKKQITKVYDENTWLAVKRFQNDNDLLPHPNGIPDSTTLQYLFL